MKRSKILVIIGPTASGKSDLAVKLAKKYTGEVISADSRQVYKGLDIGSGKITRTEMHGVPHHLLDVADPKKRFTVVDFVRLANEKIADIHSRNKLPIICGGTGFYISALVDGIILPDVPPNDALRKRLANKPALELFSILKKLDPKRAEKIDPKNLRRVIRAIEIATALGNVPSVKKVKNDYEKIFIGLSLPSDQLKKNIETRLEKRLKQGMIEEVINLHKNGLSWKRLEELGLEYKYVALYLQGKISKEEMKEKILTETWKYSKRQMTWFKKDKRIKWTPSYQLNTKPRGVAL